MKNMIKTCPLCLLADSASHRDAVAQRHNPPTYLFEIDSSAVPGGFPRLPFLLAHSSNKHLCVRCEQQTRIRKVQQRRNLI